MQIVHPWLTRHARSNFAIVKAVLSREFSPHPEFVSELAKKGAYANSRALLPVFVLNLAPLPTSVTGNGYKRTYWYRWERGIGC